MKSITVRAENEFHKELKMLMAELDMSLQEYFIGLAKKDIEERKKE